ncbi:MAG: type I pullulanase [Bacillota bacterium]
MPQFKAYLDAFHTISVLMPKTTTEKHMQSFKLCGQNETLPLSITHIEHFHDVIKYTTTFEGYVFMTEDYTVKDEEGREAELYTGKIVRSDIFDELFAYDGNDLGVTYEKTHATFKLWSPVAKRITLKLKKEDGSTENHPLTYHNQGIWSLTLKGDLEGTRYYYESYVNGRARTFTDPYAIASVENGRANVIVDTDKFVPMPNTPDVQHTSPINTVIYETSVRDFTKDPSIQATHPGKFPSFTEKGLKSENGHAAGFDYLRSLGVTHVQILPFFDFEGVDETDPDAAYNWGYNPSQYNVVEGSLSTDPADPYTRINEARTMIDTLHKEGLRVIMDVVYNHVYDVDTFPFDALVPGYAYRVNHHGYLTESSGCGNDLATERTMIRKFIVDSVMYWAKMFKVDGFRFDLMGLIDLKTMHVLRQKLESYRKDIIVYGEGWKIPAPIHAKRLTHLQNNNVLYNIGFFNDITRDYIKGSNFDVNDIGFALGRQGRHKTIESILKGGTVMQGGIKYPCQSLNYVECHDDYTFYDQTLKALPKTDESSRLRMQKLATSMVILAQGVPFIHSGQEFYRTKEGIKNSYRSPDTVNRIDWNKKDAHLKDIGDLRRLLEIRKAHPLFRIRTPYEIETRVTVDFKPGGTCLYRLQGEDETLLVVFKNKDAPETIPLDKNPDVLYHSEDSQVLENGTLTLSTISTTILRFTGKDD